MHLITQRDNALAKAEYCFNPILLFPCFCGLRVCGVNEWSRRRLDMHGEQTNTFSERYY